MNIAILSGNLGRDSELRTVNGDNGLNFAIGVSVGSKDKPDVMWVDAALWGKRASVLQASLSKGAKVTVSGAIKLEAYVAKDGTNKTRLRLTVDQIDLPPKAEARQEQPSSTRPADYSLDDMPF